MQIQLIVIRCPTGCRSCVSNTICTSCVSSYFFVVVGNSALCYDVCPNRFYTNTMYKVCQPCPYDCLTCDKDGSCLSCDQNDNRKLFAPVGRCLPMASFYNNGSSVCAKCPINCSMCLNNTICSGCMPGFYLSIRSTC